jgi:hypothetical protein
MTPPEEPADDRAPRVRDRMFTARFRRRYGDSPAHLVILVASFAVCGYAAARLLDRDWFDVAKWIVLAAVLHDLVLVPVYGGADWLVHRALGTGGGTAPRPGPRSRGRTRVALVNHIRFPAFLSLLALLVYWPLISQGHNRYYTSATGLTPDVFLTRWLLITAALFALSGILFGVGRWRARASRSRTGGRSAR